MIFDLTNSFVWWICARKRTEPYKQQMVKKSFRGRSPPETAGGHYVFVVGSGGFKGNNVFCTHTQTTPSPFPSAHAHTHGMHLIAHS